MKIFCDSKWMHGDERLADMVESTHMYLFSGQLRQYWRSSSTNKMQAYQLFGKTSIIIFVEAVI